MNYYYVNIVQSNIRIDEKLSNFIWKREPTCNSCRANGIIKAWNGIFIEEKTWEQYDIFYPIGLPSTVIVTENFLNFVKSNNLKNIKFTKSKDYKPPGPA